VEVNPILVDTNAYSAYKRGTAEAVAIIQQAPALAVNAVILGELFAGFAAGTREQINRRELDQFLAVANVLLLPIDRGAADLYSSIYTQLRRAGTPIPTNDMWIGASALQHGFDVFTYDAHFAHVTGLRFGRTVAELTP
jgi:tRNA(fMet)-specific endonuclease VapC